jgi:DNA-binding MarR family transcriptional regulator
VSEAIDGDAERIYAGLGVRFEQRWFGVLNQIVLLGPRTVGEIAGALRISHASVSQSRQSLEAAGLVTSEADPADARRRRLALTAQGEALVADLAPVWQAFETAALQLDDEAGGVVTSLDRLDQALMRRSLYERIRALL